jgi:hypothetical protein
MKYEWHLGYLVQSEELSGAYRLPSCGGGGGGSSSSSSSSSSNNNSSSSSSSVLNYRTLRSARRIKDWRSKIYLQKHLAGPVFKTLTSLMSCGVLTIVSRPWHTISWETKMLPLWNKSRHSGQCVCRCALSQPGVQRCIHTSLDKRWHRKIPSLHPIPVHIAFQHASFMRLTFGDFRYGRYYICHWNVFVYLCWICCRDVTSCRNSRRWNSELETNGFQLSQKLLASYWTRWFISLSSRALVSVMVQVCLLHIVPSLLCRIHMTILSSTPRSSKVLSLRLKNLYFLYALPILASLNWSHYDDYDVIKSAYIFQKSRSQLIILGLRRLAWSKFPTDDPQIRAVGVTVQNLVAWYLCIRDYGYDNIWCIQSNEAFQLGPI